MISNSESQAPKTVVPFDILCGRDKSAFHNAGNKRFLEIVSQWVGHYMKAPKKTDKSAIVNALVEAIRAEGGRFLKKQNTPSGPSLVELSKRRVREKVAHSLRDMAAHKKNSKKDVTTKTSTFKDAPAQAGTV